MRRSFAGRVEIGCLIVTKRSIFASYKGKPALEAPIGPGHMVRENLLKKANTRSDPMAVKSTLNTCLATLALSVVTRFSVENRPLHRCQPSLNRNSPDNHGIDLPENFGFIRGISLKANIDTTPGWIA